MEKSLFQLDKLVRKNIKDLSPYSSARSEFTGSASVFLDANENPMGSVLGKPYNRYPDPLQQKLKQKLAAIKETAPEKIFVGNGSDEPIDLLFRAFCEPGKDEVIQVAPTYGMYKVAADVNDIKVTDVLLSENFELLPEKVIKSAGPAVKLIFICSPNNPTGNAFPREKIKQILNEVSAIVVVDEAYIDFAPENSLLPDLQDYPNLVILQTLSKAWGLAALRVGFAFASEEITGILNKIKYPYNINAATQEMALEALDKEEVKEQMVSTILENRTELLTELENISVVKKIYPSNANFILVKTSNAREHYETLVEKGIILRDRSRVILCDNALRITVGTKEENAKLVQAMKSL